MRQTLVATALVLATLGVLAAAGCKQDAPKPKYLEPIEGIARDINTETGEVSMESQNADTGLTVVKRGLVNDKTGVTINGRVARVEDIRKGERVRVTGYQLGSGDDKRFIVTQISVSRPEEWTEVAPAATAPAGSEPAAGGGTPGATEGSAAAPGGTASSAAASGAASGPAAAPSAQEVK
jgi:hypothetical protein